MATVSQGRRSGEWSTVCRVFARWRTETPAGKASIESLIKTQMESISSIFRAFSTRMFQSFWNIILIFMLLWNYMRVGKTTIRLAAFAMHALHVDQNGWKQCAESLMDGSGFESTRKRCKWQSKSLKNPISVQHSPWQAAHRHSSQALVSYQIRKQSPSICL